MAFLFAFFNDLQPQSASVVANLLQNYFALYAVAVFLELYWQTHPNAEFFKIIIYLFLNTWDHFIT